MNFRSGILSLQNAEYGILWTNTVLFQIIRSSSSRFIKRPLLVASDLTYVRVRDKWCYICILIDLFNREIIGYSAGAHKDARLVYDAFLSSSVNLSKVRIFHTDRGKITRSLSNKGCPYDNAVAEATYKIFKTEFVMNKTFDSLELLKSELADYVHWFNNCRIHGSLGYLSPLQFKSSFSA